MSKRLEKLGAEVARLQDEALADGRRRAAARQRLLSGDRESTRRDRSSRWVPVIAWAGAMAAIALAIIALWPTVAEPIAYSVEGDAESRRLDRAIAAPDDRPISVGFTDGSAVRLGPSARARVRQLGTEGATVTLDRGEATVAVRHRGATRWLIEAGPFFVRVTGTRFHVGWQPDVEAFDLAVFEGEVRVSGPGLPERTVRDGEEIHRTLAPQPPPEPAPPSEVSKPAPSTERPTAPPSIVDRSPARSSARPLELRLPPKQPNAQADESVLPELPATESTPPTSEPQPQEPAEPPIPAPEADPPLQAPTWKTLLERGSYAELLTTLGPDEVERALWQAAPNQLIDLGSAARRLGDSRAGHIYSVVRSRFPSTEAAADAAFLLGRMQFHSGAYDVAATWIETYLRERPDGRFAREAAGRLVEAYDLGRDDERAREAARRYLDRYPSGPHAQLARSVLE